MFQGCYDFLGGKILGIYEAVHAHAFHGILVGGIHEAIVRHPRHGHLGAEALGDGACHEVGALVGCHGDEQVGVARAGVFLCEK